MQDEQLPVIQLDPEENKAQKQDKTDVDDWENDWSGCKYDAYDTYEDVEWQVKYAHKCLREGLNGMAQAMKALDVIERMVDPGNWNK